DHLERGAIRPHEEGRAIGARALAHAGEEVERRGAIAVRDRVEEAIDRALLARRVLEPLRAQGLAVAAEARVEAGGEHALVARREPRPLDPPSARGGQDAPGHRPGPEVAEVVDA